MSKSLAEFAAAANKTEIIFHRGVYLVENTYPSKSVNSTRIWQANSAQVSRSFLSNLYKEVFRQSEQPKKSRLFFQ